MQTAHVMANWPDILDQLCSDFRELERHKLRNTITSFKQIAPHLAQTHDLTLAEAEETLLDWHFAKSPSRAQRKAA